eukprot:g7076.t1
MSHRASSGGSAVPPSRLQRAHTAAQRSSENFWDMCIVFPYHSRHRHVALEDYLNLFLGLVKNRVGDDVMDHERTVFRSARCFVGPAPTPDAQPAAPARVTLAEQRDLATRFGSRADDFESAGSSNEENSDYVESMKKVLTQEYEEFARTCSGGELDSLAYCKLVARTVVSRLHNACGLETRMYYALNKHEIFCLVRADSVDLANEAETSHYRLQLRYQPFTPQHRKEDADFILKHRKDYEKSRKHLWSRNFGGGGSRVPQLKPVEAELHWEHGQPEMDPVLFRTDCQQPLKNALELFGHQVAVDARGVLDDGDGFASGGSGRATMNLDDIKAELEAFLPGGWFRSFFYISYDPNTYLAPYAEYQGERHFEPFYRKYPHPHIPGKFTMFRDVDRLRLCRGIVSRHLNIRRLQHMKRVHKYFVLHNDAPRGWLRDNWARKFRMYELIGPAIAPLVEIRDYFGEKVALYFAWLEFYTKMLVLPALFGTPFYFLASHNGYVLVAFGGFVGLWSALLMTFWERKNRVLTYWWGSNGHKDTEKARHQFVGRPRRNPVTDQIEQWHAKEQTLFRKMAFSATIIFLALLVCISTVASIFRLKYHMAVNMKLEYAAYYAGIVNAVQISAMNVLYQYLAQWLTTWENHRSDSQHERNLVVKTFVFQFVNSYASFFYIAFLKDILEGDRLGHAQCSEADYTTTLVSRGYLSAGQPLTAPQFEYFHNKTEHTGRCGGCLYNGNGVPDCMYELQLQLASVFIARLVLGNLAEIGYPYFMYRYKMWRHDRKARHTGKSVHEVAKMQEDDNLTPPELEAKMTQYSDIESFNDFCEIVLQYGFVCLFVVAFPLTPLFAYVNNVVEMHVDAYKLTDHHRRPQPNAAENIGVWSSFMEFMGVVSIVTNCGIVFYTSDVFPLSEYSYVTKLLLFLVFENALLALRKVIKSTTPESPGQLDALQERGEFVSNSVFKEVRRADQHFVHREEQFADLAIHSHPTLGDESERAAFPDDVQLGVLPDEGESEKNVLNCKGLTEIYLSDCTKITDAAIIALAEKCKGLVDINLTRCTKITDAGVWASKAALPECSVWGR